MKRPLLFLDFDDVICLNRTCGGYDAIHAVARAAKEPGLSWDDFQELWEQLFDADAGRYLKSLHDEFSPRYVLTTSWWWLLEKDALVEILQRCGLGFVADNLHEEWATPKQMHPNKRVREINFWRRKHPELDEAWVILDDELSGTGLSRLQMKPYRSYIVLCKEGVGLTEVEFNRLRSALLLRASARA